MSAPRQVTDVEITKLVTEFKSLGQNHNLYLLSFAKKVIKLKTVSLYGSPSESVSTLAARLNKETVIRSIIKRLSIMSQWSQEASKSDRFEISNNREKLKKIFGPHSYTWAWCLKQLGEVGKSKKILLILFEKSYEEVMSLKRLRFSYGSRMNALNRYLAPLKSMSNNKEQQAFKEMLRKAKMHLSTLPDSRILT
jgi:hypothetical protein